MERGMKMKNVKEMLEKGELIYGTHIFAGMPMLTEAIAQCGFDLLWIYTRRRDKNTRSA